MGDGAVFGNAVQLFMRKFLYRFNLLKYFIKNFANPIDNGFAWCYNATIKLYRMIRKGNKYEICSFQRFCIFLLLLLLYSH